eukprot:1161503-Pelagomonas_calceolata.AAC.7
MKHTASTYHNPVGCISCKLSCLVIQQKGVLRTKVRQLFPNLPIECMRQGWDRPLSVTAFKPCPEGWLFSSSGAQNLSACCKTCSVVL